MTPIRLDETVRVLSAKSHMEAVRVALREIVALKGFQDLMKKNAGKLNFAGSTSVTWPSPTARSINTNHADFEMIHHYRKLRLEIW
jgi:hypothetical protein